MGRCYSRLAFHVYRLRIVTRIPLPSCFSHIHSADPRPRHHGITLTCQSRLPYVISRLFISSSRYCPFFVDLVYLRDPVSSSSPTSIPRDLFLLPSAARAYVLSFSLLASRHFDITHQWFHHYCNVLAAILASLSSISFSFPSSFDKVLSFCSVRFLSLSFPIFLFHPLKHLVSSTDTFVSTSPRAM